LQHGGAAKKRLFGFVLRREGKNMKEVKAIIQPFMLHRVLDALHVIEGLPAVTVSEVDGISVKQGRYEPVKKTKLEIMVPDELVGPVMGAIQANAHTGKSGDGRIFVIPIEEALKIRTGEIERSE
jgi:nitrogen regulatory protein P-II 1